MKKVLRSAPTVPLRPTSGVSKPKEPASTASTASTDKARARLEAVALETRDKGPTAVEQRATASAQREVFAFRHDENVGRSEGELLKKLVGLTIGAPDLRTPELVVSSLSMAELIRQNVHKGTLIVTDPFNAPTAEANKGEANVFVVESNDVANAVKLLRELDYESVLAVGGGVAQDIGRIAGIAGAKVTTLPRMAHACLASAKSILEVPFEGRSKHAGLFEQDVAWRMNADPDLRSSKILRVHTPPPEKIIVSAAYALDGDAETVAKGLRGAYGDLFAQLSAAVDKVNAAGSLDYEAVMKKAPEAAAALRYTLERFNGYDTEAVKVIAEQVYEANVKAVHDPKNAVLAGGEHEFYYDMVSSPDRKGTALAESTHGELVAIGTLMTAKAVAQQSGDGRLFDALERASKKLGIPTTVKGLEERGLSRAFLLEGLRGAAASKPGTFLARATATEQQAAALFDATFG
jgi:glycerol dehydrogenase-like iron-containing ADH family enzyme